MHTHTQLPTAYVERLVRVTSFRRLHPSVAYIVPAQDSNAAINLITKMVCRVAEIEDLGRVDEVMPRALHLHPAIQKL